MYIHTYTYMQSWETRCS